MHEASDLPKSLSRWVPLASTIGIVIFLRLNAEGLAQKIGLIPFIFMATALLGAGLYIRRTETFTFQLRRAVKILLGAQVVILCLFGSLWLPRADEATIAYLALPFVIYLIFGAVIIIRTPSNQDYVVRFVELIVPKRMAALTAAEIRLIWMALFTWKKPKGEFAFPAFTSASVLAPVILAIAVLSIVEMAVLHLVLSQWSMSAAWVATTISIFCFVYMIGLAKSLYYLPTVLRNSGALIRLGHFHTFELPYDSIQGLSGSIPGDAEKKATANLALMSSPNVTIALRDEFPLSGPGGKVRMVKWVGLKMDDESSFRQELEQRLGCFVNSTCLGGKARE